MYKEMIEKVYQFFENECDHLDIRKVRGSFGELGAWDEKDNPSRKIREAVQNMWVDSQLLYAKKMAERFCGKIIFMKGLMTSFELYGDIRIRSGSDIDILIQKENVIEVGRYLLEEGFACDVPEKNWVASIHIIHLTFVSYRSNEENSETFDIYRKFNRKYKIGF